LLEDDLTAGSDQDFEIFSLAQTEKRVIGLGADRIEPALGRRLARGGKQRAPETFGAQPERRVGIGKDFFIWIRCNPLKSPDSDEGIQGNPSIFPWFSLV
jgi:hypothetical protein